MSLPVFAEHLDAVTDSLRRLAAAARAATFPSPASVSSMSVNSDRALADAIRRGQMTETVREIKRQL